MKEVYIYNVFYFKVNNPYPESADYHYAATGTIALVGSYASEEDAEAGIKHDLNTEFGKSIVKLAPHEDLGRHTVYEDGEPIGFYDIVRCAIGEHKNYELHDADY